MPLFLADETSYTVEQIAQVIREQLANKQYRESDNMRTAVWYSPEVMTSAEWVAACALCGIKSNTARNRLSEARKML